MGNLFETSLDAIIEESECRKKSRADSIAEIENYAQLIDNLSEIDHIDARVARRVDNLHYEDAGFLWTPEDSSAAIF